MAYWRSGEQSGMMAESVGGPPERRGPFRSGWPLERPRQSRTLEGYMARKILNRKELREEHDAAEAAEKKEVKKKAPKKTTKRKSRAKVVKEVRLKAYWGVFSQSITPVVLFEYSQRKEADAKAEALSKSRKSPHFVQLVKKVIEE